MYEEIQLPVRDRLVQHQRARGLRRDRRLGVRPAAPRDHARGVQYPGRVHDPGQRAELAAPPGRAPRAIAAGSVRSACSATGPAHRPPPSRAAADGAHDASSGSPGATAASRASHSAGGGNARRPVNTRLAGAPPRYSAIRRPMPPSPPQIRYRPPARAAHAIGGGRVQPVGQVLEPEAAPASVGHHAGLPGGERAPRRSDRRVPSGPSPAGTSIAVQASHGYSRGIDLGGRGHGGRLGAAHLVAEHVVGPAGHRDQPYRLPVRLRAQRPGQLQQAVQPSLLGGTDLGGVGRPVATQRVLDRGQVHHQADRGTGAGPLPDRLDTTLHSGSHVHRQVQRGQPGRHRSGQLAGAAGQHQAARRRRCPVGPDRWQVPPARPVQPAGQVRSLRRPGRLGGQHGSGRPVGGRLRTRLLRPGSARRPPVRPAPPAPRRRPRRAPRTTRPRLRRPAAARAHGRRCSSTSPRRAPRSGTASGRRRSSRPARAGRPVPAPTAGGPGCAAGRASRAARPGRRPGRTDARPAPAAPGQRAMSNTPVCTQSMPRSRALAASRETNSCGDIGGVVDQPVRAEPAGQLLGQVALADADLQHPYRPVEQCGQLGRAAGR